MILWNKGREKKNGVSYVGGNSFWKRPEPLQRPKTRPRDAKGRFVSAHKK